MFRFSNRIYNLCMTRRHDYVFHVIRTSYYYRSFSNLVKFGNVTRFIPKLMTELTLQVSENSRLTKQIYLIAVFVKIINVKR